MKMKRTILILTGLVVTGVGIVTLTGFLGSAAWLFELTSHFRVQYAAILVLCLPLFCFIRSKGWVGITGTLLLVNLLVINPFSSHSSPAIQNKSELTILGMNVYTGNREHDRVANLIEQSNPDIVGLMEINQVWGDALQETLKAYPYRQQITREDNFGIGLYSRIPFETSRIEYFGKAEVPSIVADIRMGEDPLTLVFTHPLPPSSPDYFYYRNDQLDNISKARDRFQKNLVVFGDLNMSPWSYYFERLTKRMNLQDTRKGFGLEATWPTMWPLMKIPLDHVLVSRDIHTAERRVGPEIGSDHLPVFVKLILN